MSNETKNKDSFSGGQRRGRMTIYLTIDEALALHSLAIRERREAREQASYLLRQKLEELGMLPAVDAGGG
jgi:hypothetical protein